MPILRDGRSAYFVQQNPGKKSLCLNMQEPRALEVVKGLIGTADVLVENFSPGVIGRMGLDWEAVHAINPALIMCSISAFGQSGPLANRPGFDYIAQAYSGATSMIGDPNAAPPLTAIAIGDVGAGISALAAINAALFHRTRPGGAGQYLDIAIPGLLLPEPHPQHRAGEPSAAVPLSPCVAAASTASSPPWACSRARSATT